MVMFANCIMARANYTVMFASCIMARASYTVMFALSRPDGYQ
jgi:hypothetical protein